jgi:ribosomal peptide maturation radical SAM protein 1
MELLLRAQRPSRQPITVGDYEEIARAPSGVGDWVFAAPPISPRGQARAYRAKLAGTGEGHLWPKLAAMRRLVPRFLDECVADVLAARPRVVGFTTTFGQNLSSLALARRLKRADPALKIVLGGANCDGPMGAALLRSFACIDVVVRGEAEEVAPPLFRQLVDGAPVTPRPGLCYRDQDGHEVCVPQAPGRVAMDAVPLPRYDEYFERLRASSFRDPVEGAVYLSFEAARGCWWGEVAHCTFCGLNGSSMRFRARSPERVLDDIVELARRYQVLDLHAVDNIIDHGYFATLLPQLAARGLDVHLFWEVKANLKKWQVERLAEAGVRHVQPGIESLSTPILKLMRKGVSAWQNLRLLKWCQQAGIRVDWNLIWGFPREPAEEYARMAALMPALFHILPPLSTRLCVHRWSPYHQRPAEHGITIAGPAWYNRFLYDVDAGTLAELAYDFEWRHADGREPGDYAAPYLAMIGRWRAAHAAGAALTWRRGPGFVRVRDARQPAQLTELTLAGAEEAVFFAVDDGATLAAVCRRTGLGAGEARAILDELEEARLVYREDDRYLGLALAATPRPTVAAAAVPEVEEGEDEGAAPAPAVDVPLKAVLRAGARR